MMVLGTRHYFAPFSPSTWKSPHGPVWLSNNWTFMKLTNPALPSPEHNSISHTNASIFHMITNTLDVLVHFVANQRKIVFCAICYFAKSCWQFCKISFITLSLHYSQWSPTLRTSVHPHWSRWIPGGFEQRGIGITHPWYHPSCRRKNELRVKEVLLTIHFEIEEEFLTNALLSNRGSGSD